jgi:hypothetical protein
MDQVAIFNYMIGNTDWSVPNQHNIQVFSLLNPSYTSRNIAVPYDFDHSGLVDAHYAYPFKELPIESVRDRLYLGVCRNEETMKNAIRAFSDKKDDFYRIIQEFPYLSTPSKKQMINYLNSFYSKFDKKYTVIYDMLRSCKDL